MTKELIIMTARFPVLDEESRRILQLEEQNIIEAVENTRRGKIFMHRPRYQDFVD